MVDTLPASLTATAFSGSGWTTDLATLTATRSDPLASGASYPPLTITVNVAVNAPVVVTNTATVSGGGDQHGEQHGHRPNVGWTMARPGGPAEPQPSVPTRRHRRRVHDYREQRRLGTHRWGGKRGQHAAGRPDRHGHERHGLDHEPGHALREPQGRFGRGDQLSRLDADGQRGGRRAGHCDQRRRGFRRRRAQHGQRHGQRRDEHFQRPGERQQHHAVARRRHDDRRRDHFGRELQCGGARRRPGGKLSTAKSGPGRPAGHRRQHDRAPFGQLQRHHRHAHFPGAHGEHLPLDGPRRDYRPHGSKHRRRRRRQTRRRLPGGLRGSSGGQQPPVPFAGDIRLRRHESHLYARGRFQRRRQRGPRRGNRHDPVDLVGQRRREDSLRPRLTIFRTPPPLWRSETSTTTATSTWSPVTAISG